MADVFQLGDMVVTTEVDLDGLNEGLAQAEKVAAGAGEKVGDQAADGISAKLAGPKIADALKTGLLAAGAAVVTAVVGIGAAALDVAGQTDQASRNIQAQLGTTAEEADRLGDVALQVFGDNWFGSVEEAGEVVGLLRQQLGEMADEDLRALAGGVAAIGDNFEAEAPAVIDAVKAITTNFPGTTEAQALDMITKGFQSGMNASGDFLESITEYGGLMGNNGFKAEEFFSIMQSGMQTGVLGTDKAADAFKEFGIKLLEVNDDVWGPDGSLSNSLGMADEEINALYTGLRDGSVTVADAYATIMPKLQALDDPLAQNTIGVQLFGTMWEDMGSSAMLAIDHTQTSMADMEGSTDSLSVKYGSFGDIFGAVQRKALVAIEPIGAKLLELANGAMPVVEAALLWLQDDLPPIIDAAVAFVDRLTQQGTQLGVQLTPLMDDLAAVWREQVYPAILVVAEYFQTTIMPILDDLAQALIPVLQAALEILAGIWSNVLVPAVRLLWNVLTTLIVPVFGVVAGWLKDNLPGAARALSSFFTGTLLPAIRGIYDMFNNNLRPALSTVSGFFSTMATRAGELASAVGERLAGPLRTASTLIKDTLTGAINGAQSALTNIKTWFDNIVSAVQGVIKFVNDLITAIGKIPPIPGTNKSAPAAADKSGLLVTDSSGMATVSTPAGASGPGAATTAVTVTFLDNGLSWLREFVDVRVDAGIDATAQQAMARRLV